MICSKCEVFGHTEESCEEAFRVKSTLKNRRRQSNMITSNQPIVKAFAEKQATQEVADIALTQKNEVLTNLSEPVWTLVTKKKKNRKKKAGKTSIMGNKAKISAQLSSKQGERNEEAIQSRFGDFLLESENQSGPATNNPGNPPLDSQVVFLEQASNAQPENQNDTQLQTVFRQSEKSTSSGTLTKNQESTNRSKPDFPLEGLEEHPESDFDTSDHENMEEGLEEIEKQVGLEEIEMEGLPWLLSPDLVAAISADKDDAVACLPPVELLSVEESIPHIHTDEILRKDKVHSVGFLENLEPSFLGPPPHHDVRLCIASPSQNQSLTPSKPATPLAHVQSFDHPSPNHNLDQPTPFKPAATPIAHVQISSFDHPPPNHNIDHSQAITQTTNQLADDFDDNDGDVSFPLGFTPTKEDILTLRELMKEGVTSVPSEYQSDFLRSVDIAEDGEIVDFFQEKFKETMREDEDTNYVNFHKVHRYPRIKKAPARLTNPNFSSGLKKGFLK